MLWVNPHTPWRAPLSQLLWCSCPPHDRTLSTSPTFSGGRRQRLEIRHQSRELISFFSSLPESTRFYYTRIQITSWKSFQDYKRFIGWRRPRKPAPVLIEEG